MAQDSYTAKQIIGNAIQLLKSSGIFPIKEFDKWEAKQNKSTHYSKLGAALENF